MHPGTLGGEYRRLRDGIGSGPQPHRAANGCDSRTAAWDRGTCFHLLADRQSHLDAYARQLGIGLCVIWPFSSIIRSAAGGSRN
jgi:hypothetical protein